MFNWHHRYSIQNLKLAWGIQIIPHVAQQQNNPLLIYQPLWHWLKRLNCKLNRSLLPSNNNSSTSLSCHQFLEIWVTAQGSFCRLVYVLFRRTIRFKYKLYLFHHDILNWQTISDSKPQHWKLGRQFNVTFVYL